MAKPSAKANYINIDYTNRREAIASTCTYVNQMLEYLNSNTNSDITLPDQANTDDRMAINWIRSMANAINTVITGQSLATTPIKVPTDNIDFGHFTSKINQIISTNALVVTALP